MQFVYSTVVAVGPHANIQKSKLAYQSKQSYLSANFYVETTRQTKMHLKDRVFVKFSPLIKIAFSRIRMKTKEFNAQKQKLAIGGHTIYAQMWSQVKRFVNSQWLD